MCWVFREFHQDLSLQAVMSRVQRDSFMMQVFFTFWQIELKPNVAQETSTSDSLYMKSVLTMIPLKAVLAHASTSWDGAWPVEPLDITVWEKVPVGGRLAPTMVGPGVGGPSPRGFGGPWVVPEEGRPAAGLWLGAAGAGVGGRGFEPGASWNKKVQIILHFSNDISSFGCFVSIIFHLIMASVGQRKGWGGFTGWFCIEGSYFNDVTGFSSWTQISNWIVERLKRVKVSINLMPVDSLPWVSKKGRG